MPLSATIDDTLVCGPLLDDRAWEQVRGRRIVLQPCGHPGFPRVSPLGTRHFVHARDSGCQLHESPEHLHLKALVARAAAAAGWQAGTEVAGAGFVADVLASGPGGRVAFEIQRTAQVLREYERRQSGYELAGIRCVWFVARIPTGHRAGPDLPLFLVDRWLDDPRCTVSGRGVRVGTVARSLLDGRCRWRETVAGTAVTAEVLRQMCPACGATRELEIARWCRGACACGLPVLHADGAIGWSHGQRCCGHWGPLLTLSAGMRRTITDRPVPAGHWCLSS